MEYKVISFTAQLSHKDTTAAVAHQLEVLIRTHAVDGWEYVRLENVDTIVKGNPGCFGSGATADTRNHFKMAVFRR